MNAPVTLLYVITGTNIGGAEKALCELVERLDRKRYRVAVCSLKRSGALGPRLAEAADEFYDLGLGEAAGLWGILNFIPATVRLARIMRRVRPDIIHCFLFRASIMGRLAGCLASRPVLIAAVRVNEQSALKYFAERLTRGLVSCYTAVSEEVRLGMIKRAHVEPSAIHTIYNGIECAGFDTGGHVCEKAREEIRLALIGRMHRQKGHSIALEALKIMIDTGKRVHLYFAGDGPDEERLRRQAAKLDIDESVTFSGAVEDVVAFMAGIDIVVLPSLWEGMPNVLLEAMCAGKPIVASRLAGIQEMVHDGQSAVLCEPGRADLLAEAIMRVMNDPGLAGRLADAARRDVQERFDISRTVAATQALYGRILDTQEN